VRGRALWALGGLLAGLLVVGAGVWVGARPAPAQPPQLLPEQAAQAAGQPGNVGLPSSYPVPSATPIGWQQLPAAKAAFAPVKLVVERIGVEAPVESKGVDSHNVMQTPDHPFDVAWYPFTAQPGSGGNAVFAGHKDYTGVGPAVFWHLSDLRSGDVIDVVSAARTEVRYRVSQIWDYPLASIPMQSVLESSKQDEITVMTCSGAFHKSGGYDHRLVVRATRIA
jgi:LPXTG-site transpeptidase (sortase) family protein